ncbi:hypothetical protein H2O64_06560 [Kordia sp. YSTF-M3]|uniref:Single-stranded DNA-binding protein n=1 Tax=Kordia aestuariivivens TaxID=2759037 RepID=A0ABR7Q7J6_9FLAO|nr:hypothetical protein [Kordia aestuariivivens]MBC8754326.1 hypothetical protein [Kordia aestuariivivens]
MQNSDLDFQFNESATLTGVYTKCTISQRGQAKHSGHYKIVVNDTLEVILLPPYLKEAIRPKEEFQKFEGKKVTVTGIITEDTSFSEPSLEEQPLSVDIPCFITIESIQLAEY